MTHRWIKDEITGIATCTRCAIQVKTYKVKRGGIPKCNPPKMKLSTPHCISNLQKPPITCFHCPGRLKERLCKDMIKEYVDYKHSVGE